MALPASFYTANRIVLHALRDAGRLQFGQTPTPEILQEAMDRLRDLILAAQTRGIKLWLNNLRTVTLVASQRVYELSSPRELRVLEGWYVRTLSGNRQPLRVETWNTYHNLGVLTQEGYPTQLFPNKLPDRVDLYVWLVPNAQAAAEGHLELVVQTLTDLPEKLTDELSFPPEWFLYLRWGLADELATGQPVTIMERCERKAKEYREMLEDWDVEDGSISFAPDYRGQASSRFDL